MATTKAERQAAHHQRQREIKAKRSHAIYRISQARRELKNMRTGRYWVTPEEKFAEIDVILLEAIRALKADADWDKIK